MNTTVFHNLKLRNAGLTNWISIKFSGSRKYSENEKTKKNYNKFLALKAYLYAF